MAKKRYYAKGSSMIPSAAGQFANLYQGSFMKAIPSTSYMTFGAYPDTPVAIDAQMAGIVSKAKKNVSKTRF